MSWSEQVPIASTKTLPTCFVIWMKLGCAHLFQAKNRRGLRLKKAPRRVASCWRLAGDLRRIATRVSTTAIGRIRASSTRLDLSTDRARDDALVMVRLKLQSWLDFLGGPNAVSASAARAIGLKHT
jgi:hypothetical protein